MADTTDGKGLTLLRKRMASCWFKHGSDNAIAGLRLTRATEPSGTIRALYQTSFCLVLQGVKLTSVGDLSVQYQTGDCLFASVNMPVISRIIEASPDYPYLALSLEIDPAMLAALLADSAGVVSGQQTNRNGHQALRTARAPDDVYDPLIRLLELLDHPKDIAVLAPLIQRELCWRLLRSPLGVALQETGNSDSETARIGRVTAWLREHYHQTFPVADLADMANMSPASFYRHFKAITQLTPIQFQKLVRLQEARRLLLTEHEVASVGYQVGYESPSQFSRDYRKLFGAPPGKDKATMRSDIAIESHV
ncbi:AraC family transcriptional regulator [Aestuariibacter sp. A3R04]|uniref:AraC family transcriptional regulator n=1 Tax=Aestuariibacter sp. A3R04 TaxID=2841571 RepID=UPI0020918EA9|nr:AraC family transcriptional regulator [Aestuariibacter sp. A3R04]